MRKTIITAVLVTASSAYAADDTLRADAIRLADAADAYGSACRSIGDVTYCHAGLVCSRTYNDGTVYERKTHHAIIRAPRVSVFGLESQVGVDQLNPAFVACGKKARGWK